MTLPELSIRRPVFVTCLFLVILGLGLLAHGRLGVSLYPDVNYPIVNILVPYPGAGPQEVESQVSQPIEDALSSLSGIRSLRSTSQDGAGVITVVFGLDTDMRFAEQKVSQTLSRVRGDLPHDILEPIVRSVDPSATPVLTLSLKADLPESRLYDLADREILPVIEQVPEVGQVEIQGARKREIQVALDQQKLIAHEISAGEVAERIGNAGLNLPAGRISSPPRNPETQTMVRTVGQFGSLQEIGNTVIRFVGNEAAIPLYELGEVHDGLEEEISRVYISGVPALAIRVFRQSSGNTVAVADEVGARIRQLNADLKPRIKGFDLAIARDSSKPIREGTADASEAIEIGVALTVLVVFLFLGNLRSTVITGLALPNSLLGAFVLMWVSGFTINITTLAALSLAVGLLIDDAIVVRENIFRKMQEGEAPAVAAVDGTHEVTLAVVATTLTVLSVFGPISFLRGIAGQFFKQFGLTICFAMLISLLDSLTVAPMLSAYFGGRTNAHGKRRILEAFERYQKAQDRLYHRVLTWSLHHPLKTLGLATAVFALSFPVLSRLPKSFIPTSGGGELNVSLELPPGTALDATDRLARQVDLKIRGHGEVARTVLTAGGDRGEPNQAQVLVQINQSSQRKLSTDEFKEVLRRDLKEYPKVTSTIQDAMDFGGGAGQPFVLHISGENLDQLKKTSEALVSELAKSPDLKDVASSYREGAPELQIQIDRAQADTLGVSGANVAQELRLALTGTTPARFHEQDRDYAIRVSMREDQRDLRETFDQIRVPNLNHRLLPLADVSRLVSRTGPSAISREDRRRYVEISADVNPHGRGLGSALQQARTILDSGRVRLEPGMRYEFAGQTRDFEELLSSITLALGLSVGFMYLVLASLYDSFFVPLAIMLVLPLAVCGAFYGLAVTRSQLDVYSLVGCILLLGVAAKNSILLVDFINDGVKSGRDLRSSILHAGQIRLRPIMMTSFALIAGMLPVAIPLEEAARSRSSMAIAVIGGIVTSTLLTLVVVPAAYGYILRLQSWILHHLRRFRTPE